MAGNIRVHAVVSMIRNHSEVKVIQMKPLVLQWVGALSDVSDVSDICDTDAVPEEFVSYDNRNENKNETLSHASHASDRNQEQDLKPPLMQTCPKCGEEKEPYRMKIHRCEGTD